MKTFSLLSLAMVAFFGVAAHADDQKKTIDDMVAKVFIEDKVDIATADDCDTDLFTYYIVKRIYTDLLSNPNGLTPEVLLALSRIELNNLEGVIKQSLKKDKRYSEQALNMCKSLQNLLDAHDKFYDGRLKADGIVPKPKKEVGLDGLFPDAALSPEYMKDVPTFLLVWGIEIVFNYTVKPAIDNLFDNSDAQANKEKKAEYDRLSRDLGSARKVFIDDVDKTGGKLARNRKWEAKEHDLSLLLDQGDRSILDKHDGADDYFRVLCKISRERTRDPFSTINACRLVPIHIGSGEGVADNFTFNALRLIYKARYIPPEKEFDGYRAQCLTMAGVLLSKAANEDSIARKYGRFAKPKQCVASKCAIAVWTQVLEMLPKDPTGEIRMRKAIALALAGDLQEAIKLMNEVASLRQKQKCKIHAYCIAAMYAANGESIKSLQCIEQGVKNQQLGTIELEYINDDKDFDNFNRDQTKRIFELKKELGGK